ncbi:MAG: VanZ family protein [Anaerolineae bacterium]|nr:VanZ family protein [Anaerolineae bacterium]
MGIIFSLSSIPGSFLPEVGGEPRNILFHLVEYTILALLLLRATAGKWFPAGAISLGWAALDEWYQSFVPGRASSFQDFFVDMLGISLGLILGKGRR